MSYRKHTLCQRCWHRAHPDYPYIIIAGESGRCCGCGEQGDELVPERGPDSEYSCQGRHQS